MTGLSFSTTHALGSSAVGSPVDDAAISVSGLVKSYGSTTAVRGLDLTVMPGSIRSQASAFRTCGVSKFGLPLYSG